MADFNPVSTHPGGDEFLNIAGAATTVVKASPGVLVAINVNKAVASGVITVYDNASAASGTKVATITNPGTLLHSQIVFPLGCRMSNGIVVVTSQADDLTVVYR